MCTFDSSDFFRYVFVTEFKLNVTEVQREMGIRICTYTLTYTHSYSHTHFAPLGCNCDDVSVWVNACECACCASLWCFKPWWPWESHLLKFFIIITHTLSHLHIYTVTHTHTLLHSHTLTLFKTLLQLPFLWENNPTLPMRIEYLQSWTSCLTKQQ